MEGTIALAVFNLARVVGMNFEYSWTSHVYQVCLFLAFSIALGYPWSTGQVVFGHICDKIAYTNVIIFSGTVSALSAFFMWGFAHNLATIFAFVVVFGAIVRFVLHLSEANDFN